MNAIAKFLTSLSSITRRTGVCANVGLIAGALAGVLVSLLDLLHSDLVLSNQNAIYLSLILGAFTWTALIFILSVLVRYTFKSIAFPALVNCMFTCFLLVFICKWIGVYTFAWLIGIVVGLIVGQLLCLLNFWFGRLKGIA